MRLLIVDGQGQESRHELPPGVTAVGGGAPTALQVAGLEAEAARLTRDGDRVLLEPLVALSVNAVRSPLRLSRLLLPEDRVELEGGVKLSLVVDAPRPPLKTEGTASLLRDLMGNRTQVGSSAVASMMCLTGLDAGKRLVVGEGRAIIGRGDEVGLRIRDRTVSRRHAQLRRSGAELTIEDLASPNGVLVNGSRIAGRHALQDGDTVELGHALLRVALPATAKPPAAAPAPASVKATPPGQEAAASASPAARSGDGMAAPPLELVTEPGEALAPQVPAGRRGGLALIALGGALAVAGGLVSYGIMFGQ